MNYQQSDECGSEISTLNSNKALNSHLKNRGKNPVFNRQLSSESNSMSIELNKPIIAKLKAGVKLQVTERVAEKQGTYIYKHQPAHNKPC